MRTVDFLENDRKTILLKDHPMHKEACLKQTLVFVKGKLKPDPTGHDFTHTQRVVRVARRIAASQGADLFITAMAALLHDVADWKFHKGSEEAGPKMARTWLKKLGLDTGLIQIVSNIIREVSFKGAGVRTTPKSLEGQAVQDADRLDALGAIGIARAFAYGGFKGRLMYDPKVKPRRHLNFAQYKKSHGHTIGHFYEKLLLLKRRMNTPLGKKMARERHAYLAKYLKRFLKEWG
jgi:uncharacterized protein